MSDMKVPVRWGGSDGRIIGTATINADGTTSIVMTEAAVAKFGKGRLPKVTPSIISDLLAGRSNKACDCGGEADQPTVIQHGDPGT